MNLIKPFPGDFAVYELGIPLKGFWGYALGTESPGGYVNTYLPFPYTDKRDNRGSTVLTNRLQGQDVFKTSRKIFYDYEIEKDPEVGKIPGKEKSILFSSEKVIEVLSLLQKRYNRCYVLDCASTLMSFYKGRINLSIFRAEDVLSPEVTNRSGAAVKIFCPVQNADLATLVFSDVDKMFDTDGFVLSRKFDLDYIGTTLSRLKEAPEEKAPTIKKATPSLMYIASTGSSSTATINTNAFFVTTGADWIDS